ncbi:MAG: hypothetical protein R2729_22255 [Bryobacteraceae bacterium]
MTRLAALFLAAGAFAAAPQKKPSNDGWVQIPQKGDPAPKPAEVPGEAPVTKDAAAGTETAPVPNTDDERPPMLRRGGSGGAHGQNLPPSSGVEIVSDDSGRVIETKVETPEAAPPSGDPEIDKARRVAVEFDERVPDFVCDQVTVRYEGEGLRGTKWTKLDRIEAELMVVKGKEDYRNLRRNGKAIKTGTPFDSGSWASGDFHAVQMDVLSPATNADFKPAGDSEVRGRKALKYTYTVRQLNSHWKVAFNNQTIYPAYRGTVWFDAETARILRLEMQGRQLPKKFPLASVEMVLEFGLVGINGKGYLVPVTSGNLACKAESAMCTKNETTYSNYRKFATESTLITTDSTITFEGQEGPKPPAAKKK